MSKPLIYLAYTVYRALGPESQIMALLNSLVLIASFFNLKKASKNASSVLIIISKIDNYHWNSDFGLSSVFTFLFIGSLGVQFDTVAVG